MVRSVNPVTRDPLGTHHASCKTLRYLTLRLRAVGGYVTTDWLAEVVSDWATKVYQFRS